MNIALISKDYSKTIKSIEQSLKAMIDDSCFQIFICSDSENIIDNLSYFSPDIIITENLSGFHMTTLMDGIAFNIMHSIQFHLLTDDSWNTEKNLKILSKPLSLSMFFLCSCDKYISIIQESNPDIPYVETVRENNFTERILSIIKHF